MILAGTGHRPEKLGGYGEEVYDDLFAFARLHLSVLQPTRVISGMALGWDTALAEAAVTLDIPLYAYVPFQSQASRWAAPAQRLHRNLLAAAAHVEMCEDDPYAAWKLEHRNRCMVDDCDKVLALYDGEPTGGTANCIRYATKVGRPIINLWSGWNG